jgi:hypothetical protein
MFALYLLLQLAHAFMQLLTRSDLIDPVTDLTFLALLLLEALRTKPFPKNSSPQTSRDSRSDSQEPQRGQPQSGNSNLRRRSHP